MGDGPVNNQEEPNAQSRQFAATMRNLFTALTQANFTEQQALVIIGQVIAASFGKGKQT